MYYIFETQTKPEGTVNVAQPVGRQSLASGLSCFYERCYKMVMNTEFTSVSVMLCDADLNVIEMKKLDTCYQATE